MSDLKYTNITEKVIGAAFNVHKILGNGFQEKIYQKALAIEMTLFGLQFQKEFEMKIFFRGEEIAKDVLIF